MKNYLIGPATLKDIDFIVETIIQSEKSETDILGFANLFNLTEQKLREYLIRILAEEIDGTELSISSYLIAEYKGKAVAATAGWIEGINEDCMPSSTITANLISHFLPQENLFFANKVFNIVKDVQIKRELNTYQIESVYVEKKHRGNRLATRLLEAHEALCKDFKCKKMQIQVFANNDAAILVYQRFGFTTIKTYFSNNGEILKYFPSNKKKLMQKKIN